MPELERGVGNNSLLDKDASIRKRVERPDEFLLVKFEQGGQVIVVEVPPQNRGLQGDAATCAKGIQPAHERIAKSGRNLLLARSGCDGIGIRNRAHEFLHVERDTTGTVDDLRELKGRQRLGTGGDFGQIGSLDGQEAVQSLAAKRSPTSDLACRDGT